MKYLGKASVVDAGKNVRLAPCVMAAYKAHCSFTFLKGESMSDPRLRNSKDLKPINSFLGKITRLSDLPPDKDFRAYD